MKHHPTSKSDARENDHEECSAQEYEIMKVCHRFCSIIILDMGCRKFKEYRSTKSAGFIHAIDDIIYVTFLGHICVSRSNFNMEEIVKKVSISGLVSADSSIDLYLFITSFLLHRYHIVY